MIGGAVKWASNQLTKTQDRGISALVKSAESNATLAAKFDALTTRFEALTERFDRFVEILLANGVGIGLTAVAKLGRAPTAPTITAVRARVDQDGED
jgi:light-regulated signal transduction histidine kinase (bacteriophytochrome)